MLGDSKDQFTKSFYPDTEMSMAIKRQKYSNILAIVNIKVNEAQKALIKVKSVYDKLTKENSPLEMSEIGDFKYYLNDLKWNMKESDKIESKNEDLK